MDDCREIKDCIEKLMLKPWQTDMHFDVLPTSTQILSIFATVQFQLTQVLNAYKIQLTAI